MIDGSEYRQAGMRLKGNSSLFGLGGPGRGRCLAGLLNPLRAAHSRQALAPAEQTADQPEALPWLVRLDKYVDDQQHEGHTRVRRA